MRLYVFSIFSILKSSRLQRAMAVLICALVMACGQKGNLVLPTEAAAANRASLPQSLIPSSAAAPVQTDRVTPSTARPPP